MIVSFVLAALTLTGTITIPLLIAVSTVQGLVNASTCRDARRSS